MADADLVATLKAIQSQLDNQAIAVHHTLQQHMTSVDSRLAELKSQFLEYGSPAMFTVEPHPCSSVPRALPPQRVSNPTLYYVHEYEPPPVSQPYFYNPMSSAPQLCGGNCNTQSASKVSDESPSRKSMVKTQVPGPIICNVSTSLSSTTSGLQGLETTKINEEHLSKMMTIFSENKKQLNKLFEQCLTVLDDGDPDDDCDCDGSDPVPADARSTSELGNNHFSSNLQCDLKLDFQKMEESTTIALEMFDEIPKKEKLEVLVESELKDKIGKTNDTGLVSDDFGCLVSENSREYKIVKELDEPVQFKDGTVVLRFHSKMTELIGDNGEEFFKSYDEVHNILDAMDLQENSLRGIYTYGFEKPSAIRKFDPSHDWGGVDQAASELLKLGELIDLVISRGSNKLAFQRKVSTNSLVLYQADGICHVYVDRSANIEMAKQIVLDAKMDPAACNAMEPLIVHKDLIRNGARNEFIMEFQISVVDIYGVYYGVYGKIVLRTMLLGNRGCNSLSYIQISTLRTRCFLKAWGMIQLMQNGLDSVVAQMISTQIIRPTNETVEYITI